MAWKGERVQLVPLDEDRHLKNAMRWVNDPLVTQWLLIGDLPITRAAELDYFETVDKDPRQVAFAIETLDGEHIGFSGLHGIDYRHGFSGTGSFIGDPDNWGKGYGKDAVRVRSRYAFEVLGLRMLYSGAIEGNQRSLRMLAACGYRECGRRPKRYWKRGQFRDEILMFLEADQAPTATP
jgi:RimJ/RimL family protein N-acetyltransferase